MEAAQKAEPGTRRLLEGYGKVVLKGKEVFCIMAGPLQVQILVLL
jgi:hypothetical protein